MSDIPLIKVNPTGVHGIGVNQIGIGTLRIGSINNPLPQSWLIQPSQAISPTVPVTNVIGKPIVDMPGCVEAHTEDDGKANTLGENDPKGVRVY